MPLQQPSPQTRYTLTVLDPDGQVVVDNFRFLSETNRDREAMLWHRPGYTVRKGVTRP